MKVGQKKSTGFILELTWGLDFFSSKRNNFSFGAF